MTLTEFLTARIDEDEAAASVAIDTEVESLRADGMPETTRRDLLDLVNFQDGYSHPWRRALAECDAKRRIVERHPCDDCGLGDDPCDTLRLLALPYADHPDYQQEWKP